MSFGIIFLASLWLMIVAASWADASEDSSKDAVVGKDEYSFKWLDPDKKIYVLQNRKYLKANHLMLSALLGPGLSNSYRDTAGLSFRGSYYFTEWLGIEGFYTAGFNSENKTFEALKRTAVTTLPIVREIRGQTGVMLQYVPWYAKINVFNSILYFDWYFNGGVGTLRTALDTRPNTASPATYTEENLTSYFLGTGHMFHLSQVFTVRLDLTGAYYRAPILGNSGESTWFSNYLFGFGLGLKL